MKTECIAEQLEFHALGKREVIGRFDGGKISSDAGGILLREVEQRTHILKRLSECFIDHRKPELIEHSVLSLIQQRCFGIALGYEDLNDHDALRQDSLLALLCEKEDLTGNQRIQAQDKGKPLAGSQEGRFFHGYYKHYCYLPLYIFCGEQLLCARLRKADQDGAAGTVEELQPIVSRIRAAWPEVRIILRGDSGFCRDDILSWCEAHQVDYIVGLAKNDRLKTLIAKEMEQAREQYKATGEAARVFKDFRYQTLKSWSCERRVVGKAEYLGKGENPRFVVTSLPNNEMAARKLYEKLYCARGDMENRIKEQQLCLFADRTSTHEILSNQLRLYFSSFAYVLIQTLRRLGLAGTSMAKAQCDTIRLKLFKIGAQIRISVRKVWLSFSESYPYADLFMQIYNKLQQIPLRC